MEPVTAAHPAATRIAAAVEASLDGLVSAAVAAIWDQVPAYQGSTDEGLRTDVSGHVRAIFLVFLAGLTGRPARRADFAMTREQAGHQVPHTGIDTCGVHPHQDLAIACAWLLGINQVQHIGRAVGILADCFHNVLPGSRPLAHLPVCSKARH